MSLTDTRYEHVCRDENGHFVIAGTTPKATELVLEQTAHGWSPEELHFQHPYLTLGQIHSSLAYYWDHKDQLDQDIAARLERVTRLRDESESPPLVSRLKDERLL